MSGSVRAADVRELALRVRRAFEGALRASSPRALVAEALPPLPPKRAVVRVVAVGKAALPMMLGALDRWGERVDRGLAVVPDGTDASELLSGELAASRRVEVLEAAHPVPDERSARAAARALELVRGLDLPDLVVVLVSGGASSLAALPPEGMSLDDKRALVKDLLASGATIRDVNLVRRHTSRFKGGRLAEAAAPARVLTHALGDVIGGGLHDIGSGPSVPDPTTVEQAVAVLGRFVPQWEGRVPLSESLKPSAAPRFRARVLAGPASFAESVALALRTEAGLRARVLSPEEGDAEEMAERRVGQALALAPGDALVVPCEPTVRLPSRPGRGGRAGWVALRVLSALPDDVAFLCAATDGADGSSGAAGALVTPLDRASVAPAEIARALSAFDDAPIHEALATHLPGGPTGLNFTDVHVLARLP